MGMTTQTERRSKRMALIRSLTQDPPADLADEQADTSQDQPSGGKKSA